MWKTIGKSSKHDTHEGIHVHEGIKFPSNPATTKDSPVRHKEAIYERHQVSFWKMSVPGIRKGNTCQAQQSSI